MDQTVNKRFDRFGFPGIRPTHHYTRLQIDHHGQAQPPGAHRHESRICQPDLIDARPEFERALPSGTFRGRPVAALPEPAEATLGFPSNRKMIDKFPGPAILLGPEKML